MDAIINTAITAAPTRNPTGTIRKPFGFSVSTHFPPISLEIEMFLFF
jgi:hypothetical protein